MSGPGASVQPRHFELLRKFGQTQRIRDIPEVQKAELWSQMCQIEQVTPVPFSDVKLAWRRHVSGKSRDSGLSVQPLPGGVHTLLGVTYKGTVMASHPVKTRALLRKLLTVLRETQPDPELFLQEVIGLCPGTSRPADTA